jgi:predicted Zn finger-like uncharacterized protein
MIEVLCTSCHTRYRIDEQVLPEGIPTFKCSRCGHVFSFDPRSSKPSQAQSASQTTGGLKPVARPRGEAKAASSPQATSARETAAAIPSAAAAQAAAAAAVKPAPLPAEASAEPSTAELLSRPFASQLEDAKPGENLAFDFRDEDPATRDAGFAVQEPVAEEPKWQVGDDPAMAFQNESAPAGDAISFLEDAHPARRRVSARRARPSDDFVNEDAAPIYNHAVTRSARFFLMLFMLVAAGFLGMTVAIHNAPAGAADILSRFPVIGDRFVPPTTPARLVALRDVHADYRRTRGGQTALVITGTAENVGLRPLHVVQIGVRLRDSARRGLTGRTVYCGNNLSAKMVGEMTPHEIEFFQKLDPPKSFTLDPSAGCAFVMVFIDPPAGTNSFDISVARAVAAPETAAPGA